MKKYLILLFLLFLIPINTYAISDIPTVDSSKKVYDYADLLSEEEENKLHEGIIDVLEKRNLEVVFVTINNNPYGTSDEATQNYAADFYDYNKFGVGDRRSGVLVIIDMGNRYHYILTSGDAQLYYDDERINGINDAAYEYLSMDNYYGSFEASLKSIDNYYQMGIPESNSLFCVDDNGDFFKCKDEPKEVNWLVSALSAIAGSLGSIFIHTRKYRGIHLATDANDYIKNSTITSSHDQFLTTFTSRVRRSNDNNGSGGHHSIGGGSTIFRGSSGRSHGGGGRHF